jgi:hypothetical protein
MRYFFSLSQKIMNATDIRFRVEVNWADNTLDFYDITDYASPPSGLSEDPEFVTGYLKIDAPNGTILNVLNTGNALYNGAAAPSIIRYEGNSKTAISLPTDNSRLLNGIYKVTYQSRVWKSRTVYNIQSIDNATGKIVISGNHAATITPQVGKFFLVDATADNDGNVIVQSAADDGGNTNVFVSDTLIDQIGAAGELWMFTDSDDYQANNSYDYQIEQPVASIDMSADCKYSKLYISDQTDYNLLVDGVTVTPLSKSRTMTPIIPAGSGATPPGATTAQTLTIGPNIWSRRWSVSLSTVVTYSLDEWDGVTWFQVNGTVTGSDSLDVICDDLICCLYTCIKALRDERVDNSTSTKRKQDIDKILNSIYRELACYYVAGSCGEDNSEFLTKIKTLLTIANCNCSTNSDSASVEIIPWGGSAGTSSTDFQMLFGTAAPPSDSLGNENDVYVTTSGSGKGNFYKKISGTWQLQVNVVGLATEWLHGSGVPAVGLGNEGDFYLNDDNTDYYNKTGSSTWTKIGRLSKFVRLYAIVTDTGSTATSALQTLRSTSIPASELANEGDEIKVRAELEIVTGIDLVVNVKLGSTVMYTKSMTTKNPTVLEVEASILRKTANSQLGYGYTYDKTGPNVQITSAAKVSGAENLAIANTLALEVSSTGATLNDIVLKAMTVDTIRKI